MYPQKFWKKINFLLASFQPPTKKGGSGSELGSVSQWYGSAEPDPYQYVKDPQHWFLGICWGNLVRLIKTQKPGLLYKNHKNQRNIKWNFPAPIKHVQAIGLSELHVTY